MNKSAVTNNYLGNKLNQKNYTKLFKEIKTLIPSERVFNDELRTFAYGTDASFYRLKPKIVVKVQSEEEVVFIVNKCNKYNIPITFRASGTSLSGQSISDSVLLVADRSWNQIKKSSDNSRITLQPAVLGGRANLELAKYNKKIGPDPASINAATVSGIVSNNASGMTSGVRFNSYNTIADLRIVFANGNVLNTANENDRNKFVEENRDLILELLSISNEINESEEIKNKIKNKYRIKNTTGYSVNSFVDYQDPIEIIKHLMIGSEGTLGFISQLTLKTIDSFPNRATSLIIFPDVHTACSAIPLLKRLKVDAAEIMDRASLRSVENKSGLPDYLKELSEDAAALLIETSASTPDQLQKNIDEIISHLKEIKTIRPITFTKDPKEYLKLWNVRKGLFPSVSKARASGTTVVIEDVNFDTSQLAAAVSDLQALFKKHDYEDTIIWGHALSGNIHFVFAQDFNKEHEIKRYRKLLDDVVLLVIEKYNGSLKAEHGTGRNMAPFVKYEWGVKIYDFMVRTKKIFDPQGILNPGVLINSDQEVYIKNLKPTPIVNPIIDKCIDCGFCESSCPSKNLTLTPRQRITVWRVISNIRNNRKDFKRFEELNNSFEYYGEKTCATDGLCELACPVDIDTGKLIKQIRSEKLNLDTKKYASWLAKNFRLITNSAKYGLNLVSFFQNIFGDSVMYSVSSVLRTISKNKMPAWNEYMPAGSNFKISEVHLNTSKNMVVYFPSCISRTMGNSIHSEYKDTLTDVMKRLLIKGGFNILFPNNLTSLCCGMPFSSKGHFDLAELKSKELEKELLHISRNGKYPIVFDTSPCAKTFSGYLSKIKNDKLKIYDSVEFIHDFLIPKLNINKKNKSVSIHPTCSTTKMELTDKLTAIAKMCVTDVHIPEEITCCGFAGDRGFTFPELNKSALNNLKSDIQEHHCTNGYSSSKTCEIGLSLHSGIDYNSIAFLVDECSK